MSTHPAVETVRDQAMLRKVADRIAENPHTYDQSVYRYEEGDLTGCGTAMCVAGHAADLDPAYRWSHTHPNIAVAVADGINVSAGDAAEHTLGLSRGDADVLFAASWRPAGWRPDMPHHRTAELVRDALYRLADDEPIEAVTRDYLTAMSQDCEDPQEASA